MKVTQTNRRQMIKASDAMAIVLAENQISHGFELIGGMIAHIVDSINQLGKTKLVSLHHEQSAAFAAGAISRATSHTKLGLALGTSGPGATNLITGITDCWLDSHPAIFITGQVNTYEQKGSSQIRQQGFQELEVIDIVSSITKYAKKIETVDSLIPSLQEAIDIARSGRPGPVLLDVPMDLQRIEIDNSALDYLSAPSIATGKVIKQTEQFNELFDLLESANNPLFLVGGGAVNVPSFQPWKSKLDALALPYVTSLKGSEKTSAAPTNYGMLGAYGTRVANYAVQNSDLLIVVGSRMDVRQTGANSQEFGRNAKIIQIDIDQSQLANTVKADRDIHIDCTEFFDQFSARDICTNDGLQNWINTLDAVRECTNFDEYSELKVSPFLLLGEISDTFRGQDVHFVADVGNNQMWMAHSLKLSGTQAAHYSGGLGAMGFAIPSAIGAHYATGLPVIAVVGDGGAQLNIQELDVIARNKLPILIIVLNNASLGMVRGFQEMYFEGRNSSTYFGGYTSSFKKIGNAYGLDSYSCDALGECTNFIQDFKNSPAPKLLEVLMPDARECRPRLEFGNSIEKQLPLLSAIDDGKI